MYTSAWHLTKEPLCLFPSSVEGMKKGPIACFFWVGAKALSFSEKALLLALIFSYRPAPFRSDDLLLPWASSRVTQQISILRLSSEEKSLIREVHLVIEQTRRQSVALDDTIPVPSPVPETRSSASLYAYSRDYQSSTGSYGAHGKVLTVNLVGCSVTNKQHGCFFNCSITWMLPKYKGKAKSK